MATATQANAKLSYRQLENLYIANGGSPKFAPVMAAIGLAESRGRVNAKHVNSDGSIDQGIWQINSSNAHLYHGKNIYDPNVNAKAAIRLAEHSGNGLRNWVTFTKGTYKRFVKMPKTRKQKSKAAGAGVLTADNFVGTDQGVDFKGAGTIPALGSGIITDIGHSTIIEGGRYPYVVYKLTDGPYRGHFVYVAENFIPTVKKGTRVVMGQTIGRAIGKFPYIEVGFNRTGAGWNPVATLDRSNPHASTPAGSSMWDYIQGVTGLKKGGPAARLKWITSGRSGSVGGGIGSAASAAWNFNPITAAGDVTGIHPIRWEQEAVNKILDALAIAGGGFIFVFGFALIAADIGLSSRAGRVVAAVPAGKLIARSARPTKTSRRSPTTPPSSAARAEERREETHAAKLRETEARTKRAQAAATESRTRQKNRRKNRKEQEKAETKAYYAGARDATSPQMAKIKKARGNRKST